MNQKCLRAKELLESHGFSCEVIHGEWNQPDVVKTIVFKKKSDDSPFAVAVKKDHRVSYKKIRKLVDDQVSPLSPAELKELGWVPGECCPLTINCELYIDELAAELDVMHTGSGDVEYGLRYDTQALFEIREDAQVVDAHEK